jgi:hypothetical protein
MSKHKRNLRQDGLNNKDVIEIIILKEKLQGAITSEIPLRDFISWYEDWFFDLDTDRINPSIYLALENLNNDVGFYEPSDAIRREHSSYFGDEVLLNKLMGTLQLVFQHYEE